MFKRLLDFRGSDLADEFFADVAKLELENQDARDHLKLLLDMMDQWDWDLNQLMPEQFKDMRTAARAALGEG